MRLSGGTPSFSAVRGQGSWYGTVSLASLRLETVFVDVHAMCLGTHACVCTHSSFLLNPVLTVAIHFAPCRLLLATPARFSCVVHPRSQLILCRHFVMQLASSSGMHRILALAALSV